LRRVTKFTSIIWTALDAALRPVEVGRAKTSWVDLDNEILYITREPRILCDTMLKSIQTNPVHGSLEPDGLKTRKIGELSILRPAAVRSSRLEVAC